MMVYSFFFFYCEVVRSDSCAADRSVASTCCIYRWLVEGGSYLILKYFVG